MDSSTSYTGNMPYPEDLNSTLYNSLEDDTFASPVASIVNDTMTLAPRSLAQPQVDTGTIWTSCMAMGFVLFVLSCMCRRPAPREELWRGQEIRERYLRMQEEERAREAKEGQSPRYRHRLVQYNLQTKRVVAKDIEGNWTLGSVNSNTTQDPEASLDGKKSLECTEDNSVPVVQAGGPDDEDEEHTCVICLDSFQVGDVVSWARFSDECHHVYHTECIQPWLEERRQDECPSCRNSIILRTMPPSSTRSASVVKTESLDGMESDDEEYDEESGMALGEASDNEESFFVIMHGMISRAAQRASYTLIGTKDSMDDGGSNQQLHTNHDADNHLGSMSPSPLRRVVSTGGVFRPRSIRRAGMTAPAFMLAPSHSSGTDSSGSAHVARASISEATLERDPSNSTESASSDLATPISFRKVQSDMGYSRNHRERSASTSLSTIGSSFDESCPPASPDGESTLSTQALTPNSRLSPSNLDLTAAMGVADDEEVGYYDDDDDSSSSEPDLEWIATTTDVESQDIEEEPEDTTSAEP
eukprot:Nitzschia sp. Nitz4//scaffold108_size72880//16419//18073//NITZ4_005807-RA/size72880-augustus-gene-0.26-mRNA-1//1//CDS//3329532645//7132//frame0